jgi:hypothetical protein
MSPTQNTTLLVYRLAPQSALWMWSLQNPDHTAAAHSLTHGAKPWFTGRIEALDDARRVRETLLENHHIAALTVAAAVEVLFGYSTEIQNYVKETAE